MVDQLFVLAASSGESCNPDIEQCSSELGSGLERPPIDDFRWHMIGYFASPIMQVLSPAVARIFLSTADAGNEVFYWVMIPFYIGLVYQVPFWLSVIYLWTGKLDSVLIFWIEHIDSNLGFLTLLLQPMYLWLSFMSSSNDDFYFSEYHFLALFFGLVTSVYLWNLTMEQSIGAIRYMDPSWNKVPDGERLWPSLAYALGLADNDLDSSSKVQSASDDSESNLSVWTL